MNFFLRVSRVNGSYPETFPSGFIVRVSAPGSGPIGQFAPFDAQTS